LPGADVIVFRGSTTLQDWLRDAEAVANPVESAGLGPVHPGFNAGLTAVWQELMARRAAGQLSPRVVVTGHSLGAARATLMTGYLVQGGAAPIARYVFGEPRPGFARLAEIIKDVPAFSYRNGDNAEDPSGFDLVTSVPFRFFPELYVHPSPLIDVRADPPATDEWGVFRWHHIQLYCDALAKQ
jgi:hypothetical protein